MTFAIVAAVATIASVGVSAYGQVQAGKAQEDALQEQARQEKIAAESRELERKQELNRVLAANAASASMSGITGEGTPASISLESAKQIGASEGMINLSEKLKRAQLRRQGANARSAANIGALSSTLGSADTLFNSGKTIKDNWGKE
jgi:hypothetical protein|tara:strand:+ start:31 stop:471 length:441 start_codon:yes stop_codon:yes gene_type:complete